jgi:SWI/SNF-related matrix-associated actin-dependent regulator 1 of chromatin subfamily A
LLPQDVVLQSAKIRQLSTLLPQLKAVGSRILLFSQWTSTLDVIEWWMDQMNYTFVRLDGTTQV